MAKTKIIGLAVILTLLILSIFSGCTPINKPNINHTNPNPNKTQYNITLSQTNTETSNELKTFNSVEELKSYLDKNSNNAPNSRSYTTLNARDDMVLEASVSSKAISQDSSAGASDYSTTNVQVEGVDEADFVKNDNKYIYMISNNQLVIIDAYPGEDAQIISETKLDGNPQNLLLNENKLIVFSSDYEEKMVVSDYDFIPQPRYTSITKVTILDITDKENPETIEEYKIDGNYYDSRMIGNYIYFISQESVYYYDDIVTTPQIWSKNTKIASPQIYYFDNPDNNYVFHTISAIDISENEPQIEAKTFMLGYGSTLYVSENNIYIAYQKGYTYYWYKQSNLEMFEEIIMPLLPEKIQNKINDLDKSDENKYTEQIKTTLDEMYSSLNEKDTKDLIEEIGDAISEYEAKIAKERDKTIIHKISIDALKIEHEAQTQIKGHLLNQFSLDEYENNLRLATTLSYWTRNDGRIQYNNVYVLDEELETIGKIEEIAEDERIYSTRFMGDKLYMVTFKQIDPFFVIDLTNPEKPEILGELKIPGFSTYLHPYDETHIIGFGQQTGENEYGNIVTKGLKISLFDVTDFKNPKEVDTYEIGLKGTTSEALNEHKAILFDKEKNLLAIPVHEVISEEKYDYQYGYQRETWQGAYVFNIDENGFDLKGKVEHNYDNKNQYYWYSPYNVKRSLYLDDTLYTISNNKIVISDLETIKKINSIKLPEHEEIKNYPYYETETMIDIEG